MKTARNYAAVQLAQLDRDKFSTRLWDSLDDRDDFLAELDNGVETGDLTPREVHKLHAELSSAAKRAFASGFYNGD